MSTPQDSPAYFDHPDTGEPAIERRKFPRADDPAAEELFNGFLNVIENQSDPYWKGYISAMRLAFAEYARAALAPPSPPEDELPGPTPGFPKTSRDWLAAVVDIWDDQHTHAFGEGSYVEGAFSEAMDRARAHLSTAPQPQAGWKLVPVEPTEKMVEDAKAAHEPLDGDDSDFEAEFRRTWRAMLESSASPDPEPLNPSDMFNSYGRGL